MRGQRWNLALILVAALAVGMPFMSSSAWAEDDDTYYGDNECDDGHECDGGDGGDGGEGGEGGEGLSSFGGCVASMDDDDDDDEDESGSASDTNCTNRGLANDRRVSWKEIKLQ